MTFTAKYATIDAAREAASRSYERLSEEAADQGSRQVGAPVELNQQAVEEAHDFLNKLWEEVKEEQNF